MKFSRSTLLPLAPAVTAIFLTLVMAGARDWSRAAGLAAAALGGLTAAAGWIGRRTGDRTDPFSGTAWAGFALTAAMTLWAVSPAGQGAWFFFAGWIPPEPSGHAWRSSGLGRWIALTAVGTGVLWTIRKRPAVLGWLLPAAGAVSAVLCAQALWKGTGGEALWRDDHPSFLFRLSALAQSFPHLTYYNPFWNGGRVETAAIASGATVPGLLLWPLWKIFPAHIVYTPAMMILYIGLGAALAAGSARIAGGRRMAMGAAAILGIAFSRIFWLWALHFGTFGACVSGLFILPVMALLYRVFLDERPGWKLGLALVACATPVLSWPPAILMAGPAVVALVITAYPDWTRRRWLFLLTAAAALVIMCSPFLAGILKHGNVASFAAEHSSGPDWGKAWRDGWENWGGIAIRTNPLLVFLGLFGVFAWPDRRLRRVYGAAIIVLALISGWGEIWKPQFQLTRAAIPLALVAIVPAALWIERLLEHPAVFWIPARAALLALLALSTLNAARTYENRNTLAPYQTMAPEMKAFVEALRTLPPHEGRVLFAGPTVHAYGRGHVAYLPLLSGRPMMACDYYHFSPKMVEYEYPPRPWRSTEGGWDDFLERYNVTHVVTFHETWLKFFRKHPDRFAPVYTYGGRRTRAVFRVLRDPSWFIGPGGSVRWAFNRIDVRLDQPGTPTVLRAHWMDGMTSDPPAMISPETVAGETRFIRIVPNGARTVVIRAVPPWRGGNKNDDDEG